MLNNTLMSKNPISRSNLYLYSSHKVAVRTASYASSSWSCACSSSHSSLSSPWPRINRAVKKPISARPPKMVHARASPLGSMPTDMVNRPPETTGPTLRPSAESVCAMPLRVPRLACEGAEFVI